MEVIRQDDPRLGTVSFTVVGGQVEVEYRPAGNRAVGSDRFSYLLFDGYEFSEPITVDVQVPNQRPEVLIPPGSTTLSYHGATVVVTPAGTLPGSGSLFQRHWEDPTLVRVILENDDLELARDGDGDPLTPVLAAPPGRGTVTFVPVVGDPVDGDGYRFEYTPHPPPLMVVESVLATVVQELFAEFPSRVTVIREAGTPPGRFGRPRVPIGGRVPRRRGRGVAATASHCPSP